MVDDPLKSFESILEPDPRSDSLPGGLKAVHDELCGIALDAAVPEKVQQLFETAKNVALYSWFVYRFHQVAESIAFQALEFGLRLRCEADPEFLKQGRRWNLRVYLAHAAKCGWINNSGFSSIRHIAFARARMRKFIETINAHPGVGVTSVPEPAEEDVERELLAMTHVAQLVKTIPFHRNHLAHGSSMLSPTSRVVLRVAAEILNQLYPGDASLVR